MSVKASFSVLLAGLLLPGSAQAAAGDIWTFDPGSFSTSVKDSGLWVGPFDLSPTTPIGPYNPVHAALFSYGDSGKVVLWRDTLFMFFDLNVAASRTDVDIASMDDWDVVHHSFCSGHAFFEGSGGVSKLLVAGGDHFVPNEVDPASENLLCHNPDGGECFPDSWTSIIDPSDNSVTLTSDFNSPPRWYPTLLTLPTGEVLMAAGDYWNPEKDTTGVGLYSNGEVSPVVEWERFDSSTEQWSTQGMLLGDSVQVKNYGFFQVLPKGLFFEGPRATVPATNSAFVFPWPATTYDNVNWIVTDRQSGHPGGSAVLLTLEPPYTSSFVMMMGGGTDCDPSDFVQWKDPSSTSPTFWRKADFLNHRRTHLNAVLLPDGKVFAVGGADSLPNSAGACSSNVPVLPCEMFDPEANGDLGSLNGGEWTLMKSLLKPRMYHSVAILLPDSRVLSVGNQGGPDYGNTDQGDSCEIYYPPYLFNAAGTALATRPNITSAPTQVHYGLPFEIVVDVDGDAITEVTLHRPSSVTHSNDMTQRRVALEFAVVDTAGGQIFATAPWQPEIAPPGDYMLFVLQDGVPSHAKFVKLSRATSTAQTGSDTVWGFRARLDRDFKVESGHTLTILPNTTVYFAAADSQNVGSDAGRIEILVAGQLLAEGEIDDRITFTSSSPSPAAGDWHSVTFQDDSTDVRISSLESVDFEYPVFAIGVDSLSGNIIDCSFTGVDSAAVYVPRDTRIVEGYQWSLLAPMTVMVSNTDASPPSHGGEDTLRVEINVNGGLFTEDPTPSGDLVEFLARTADHFEGKAWYGTSIVGTGSSGDGKGVARIRDAKFDSAIFPLSFLVADTAEVADSEFWHYQDTGVTDWASDATISGNTFVRDLGSNQSGSNRDGRRAVHVVGSVATVSGNEIFYHTDQGIWIDSGSYADCIQTSPSGTNRTIVVEDNAVVEDADFEWGEPESGILATWVCHARNLRIEGNQVHKWGSWGIALEECSDVTVVQNCLVGNVAGAAHKRRYLSINATWNGLNKFQGNNFRENDPDNFVAGASPLATPTDPGFRLGESGVGGTGENRLEQLDNETWNYRITTTEAGRADFAQTLEWFSGIGSLIGDADSIQATFQLALPDTQAVDISDFVAALADTSESIPKGADCTPPSAPTFGARPERFVAAQPGEDDHVSGAPEAAKVQGSGPMIPAHWALGVPVPNPTSGGLRIDFAVPARGGNVELLVYNVEGRRVVSLSGGTLAPGYRSVTWDGRDTGGSRVSPGVYFVRMVSADFTATRKAVILR